MSVTPCELPAGSLLASYGLNGGYADCYVTDLPSAVSHAEFVEAFYTSGVFKAERLVLRIVGRGATDDQARALASGAARSFAAWSVEKRAPNQLLLSDYLGTTRSWLMVAPEGAGTRLYFGSAVVPKRGGSGGAKMGFAFRALLGFHKLYSRALLGAARRRLAGRDAL